MRRITFFIFILLALGSCSRDQSAGRESKGHNFNGPYTGDNLNRVAFPIGGIGAGMFCLDGNGAFSHMSVRHTPDVFNSPFIFAAISVKGLENGAKILEGPVQSWKIFGSPNTGTGSNVFGVPRYSDASFEARFPFGEVKLTDKEMPVDVDIKGWSPFIPTDPDNSSLPVGAVEYTFSNTSSKEVEAMFSFNSENFMHVTQRSEWGGVPIGGDSIGAIQNGFVLDQSCSPNKPEYKGDFAVFTDDPDVVVDHCWFRGGWFDSRTLLWKNIKNLTPESNPVTRGAKGASISVPLKLKPGESRTIKVYLAWYVPHSNLRIGWSPEDSAAKAQLKQLTCTSASCNCSSVSSYFFEPWYDSKFSDINEVTNYWLTNYNDLKAKSELFTSTFYGSDIPDEVKEAVAANLTILKSPTVLRQKDGKLWAWEGCHDLGGCCYGSCTHVWNYAQAISHLFPSLERSLRETEFHEDQSTAGHQTFRANLPIRETGHSFYAASDGQLGGIMKVYREWQISGNTEWLKALWPKVKQSLDYCIEDWDPRHTGALEEPHHNTYDIEFWGPDGMCTSFYLGALTAGIEMGKALDDVQPLYQELLDKGIKRMGTELYNGEYFIQKVQWKGLNAPDPVEASKQSFGGNYSPEALKVLEKEGPKYQYGDGCISDGVLGFWLAEMCGVPMLMDSTKVLSHLNSVYKYNFRTDLSNHVNPQRAGYAYGHEGGLLICTWPNHDEPTFPFVYSNEVWTGIEYQVASHLMMMGEKQEGLNIVKEVRKRYDGRIRNPFDEYECGHWYARAMSSYGLLQGLTGITYNALTQTMTVDSRAGNNFKCFFSCETGFGFAGLKNGKPFAEAKYGTFMIKHFVVDGKTVEM